MARWMTHCRRQWLCLMVTVLVAGSSLVLRTVAQGTGVSVPLTDEELDRIERERTRNVVRLAATDQLNSEIITNRTRGKLFIQCYHCMSYAKNCVSNSNRNVCSLLEL